MDLETLYQEERKLLVLLVKSDPVLDKEFQEHLKEKIGRLNKEMRYLEEVVH